MVKEDSSQVEETVVLVTGCRDKIPQGRSREEEEDLSLARVNNMLGCRNCWVGVGWRHQSRGWPDKGRGVWVLEGVALR